MTHVAAYLVHWREPVWCRESVEAILESCDVTVSCTVINNDGVLALPVGVKIVETGRNLGFAGGANVALDLSRGGQWSYVFIGCHDIRLDRSALSNMIRFLEADPGLGVVGPVLDGEGGSESDLDWISGAAMLMRGEIAEAIRFNDKFGSYVEDVDFCYRVRRSGWRIGRCGSAGGMTRGSVDEARKALLMNANTIAFFLHEHLWRPAAARVLRIAESGLRELRHRHYRTAARYFCVLPLSTYRYLQIALSG